MGDLEVNDKNVADKQDRQFQTPAKNHVLLNLPISTLAGR